MISSFILFTVLIILSVQDIKERQIYTIIPIIGTIIGYIIGIKENQFLNTVINSLFAFLILFLPYMVIKLLYKIEAFGFGDVLVSTCIGAFCSLEQVYFTITLMFLLAYIFCTISKKKTIALVPFFTLSLSIIYFSGV